MKTLVIVAHPDPTGSLSQQFLISSGKEEPNIAYLDLTAEFSQNYHQFDTKCHFAKIKQADKIIFQFPLHWYQAPAVLKIWLDAVLETDEGRQSFANKKLGLVVTAGVGEEHYQLGGRELHPVSALLLSYQSLANHLGMEFNSPLIIYQFELKTELEKSVLMYRYRHYLTMQTLPSFSAYQSFIIDKLTYLNDEDVDLSLENEVLLDFFIQDLISRQEELDYLHDLMKGW